MQNMFAHCSNDLKTKIINANNRKFKNEAFEDD